MNYVPCPEHKTLELPPVGKYKTHFRETVCPQWLCQLKEEERQKQWAKLNQEGTPETIEYARMLAEEHLPLAG